MAPLSWRTALVWLVAAVLLTAGLPKIADPLVFRNIMRAADLLPQAVQTPVAWLLPWVELVCAGALLSARWRHGGLLVAGGLGAIYAGHALAGLFGAPDKPCGCFGPNTGGPLTWGISLGLGLLMLLIALLVLWLERPRPQPAR
jgi:hypothetical protein